MSAEIQAVFFGIAVALFAVAAIYDFAVKNKPTTFVFLAAGLAVAFVVFFWNAVDAA